MTNLEAELVQRMDALAQLHKPPSSVYGTLTFYCPFIQSFAIILFTMLMGKHSKYPFSLFAKFQFVNPTCVDAWTSVPDFVCVFA